MNIRSTMICNIIKKMKAKVETEAEVEIEVEVEAKLSDNFM